MTTPVLTPDYLDQLTRPEPRLPGLSSWLLNEVWSEAAFEAAGRSPVCRACRAAARTARSRPIHEREPRCGSGGV